MKRWPVVLRLLILLLLGLTVTATAQEPMTYDEFTARLPQWQANNSVPGMAVVLVQEGELVDILTFGVKERGADEPIAADTLFQAGSLAKPVAGSGMLAYFAEQEIPLDTAIGQLVSLWPGADPALGQITLEQLLAHRSGLIGAGYPGFAVDEPLPTLEESLTGALPGYEPVALTGIPGEQFAYTSAGYVVLQYVVEELSGEPFAALMDRFVGEPLGLEGVSFAPEPVDAATGHGFYGAKLPQYRFPEQAAAGLNTAAAGLVPFLLDHFADEPQLGVQWQEYVLAPLDEEGMQTPLYTRQVLPEGTEFLAASGVNRGFRSYLAFVPATESAILILTNSDRGHYLIQDIFPAWMGLVSDELITASPVASIWVWFFTVLVGMITVAVITYHLRRLPLRLPARSMPIFVVMMLWPMAISVSWVVFWHTDWLIRSAQGQAHYIPAQFMPRNFWVLSLAIVVLCLVQAGFTVLRQLRGNSTAAASLPTSG